MVKFGPLMAEICWGVWGTPANFNRFRVLASLLHWRRSTEVNQTLHDVWPSPGLVHCIYIFGGSCPLTEFCEVQNSLCVQVQVLCSPMLAVLLHSTRAVGISQTLRHSAEGATYIQQDGHHVGHWPAIQSQLFHKHFRNLISDMQQQLCYCIYSLTGCSRNQCTAEYRTVPCCESLVYNACWYVLLQYVHQADTVIQHRHIQTINIPHFPQIDIIGAMVIVWRAKKGKKVKASHTRHRALGPELIPVYRQSACRWP